MKNYILLFLLVTSPLQAVVSLANFNFQRKARSSPSMSSFNNPYMLGEQYTITKPGIYGLNISIPFEPTGSGQSCIVIDSDDVVLDLNLKTIMQASDNTQPGTVGITVTSGCQNVVIRNGNIRNVTGSGIVVEDGCGLIDIFDVSVLGMGNVGLDFRGTSTSIISNILLSNVIVEGANPNGPGDVYGVRMAYANVINCDSCVITNNICPFGALHDMYLTNASSVRIQNCILGESISGGLICNGLYLNNCKGILLNDTVSARHTNSSANPSACASGFEILNSETIIANSLTAGDNQGAFAGTGIRINTSSLCNITSSICVGNGSTYGKGIGYNVQGGEVVILKDCLAGGNAGATIAAGFSMGTGIIAGVLDTCESSFSSCSTGTAAGIYVDNTAVTCAVTGCEVTGNAGAGGYGVLDTGGASSSTKYLANVATGNTTNFSPGEPLMPMYTGTLHGTPGTFENVSI